MRFAASSRIRLANDWQKLVIWLALFGGFAVVLWFKLGTLNGGYGPSELATVQASTSWLSIFHHPLNAPYTALIHAASYLTQHTLLAARLISAVIGLATLIVFYALARYWHGERTAIFGTVLFGLSAWFLHTTRLGTPDVLLFGLLGLVACYIWLRKKSSPWALICAFILAALLLYVPGMIWLLALGAILQWKTIDKHFKHNLWAVTVGGLILLIALTPLGLAIYHEPEVAKVYAGLPAHGWPMPLDVLRNLGQTPLHLFYQGSVNSEHWLGKLAILDYFTTAMVFLGGYLYVRHIKLRRSWLVLAIISIGIVLASLGGAVSLTVILPFVYIIAAAGIGSMLDRWLTVFPRNVIAQSVGYGLVGVAVIVACLYSVQHYFVAWPQAPETKAIFTVQDARQSATIKK